MIKIKTQLQKSELEKLLEGTEFEIKELRHLKNWYFLDYKGPQDQYEAKYNEAKYKISSCKEIEIIEQEKNIELTDPIKMQKSNKNP